MTSMKLSTRYVACGTAACLGLAAITPKTHAAFHLWALNEIYSNSSGTLQFIELRCDFSSQNFISGVGIGASNLTFTQTNNFTIPGGSDLPGNTFNHYLLFGTAGLAAAGGPTPDFIIPNGFLFTAGGSINFFGFNGGAYAALPIDGLLSRTWGGGNALNSPTNYAGQTGVIPAPGAVGLLALSGAFALRRRRTA